MKNLVENLEKEKGVENLHPAARMKDWLKKITNN